METLIKNLKALLGNTGEVFEDRLILARLHSSNTDSNSYLTVWYNEASGDYYLAWIYINNYDMVVVLDGEIEDVAETLNQAKELFKAFFR